MQYIETKYLPATNTKGSRIRATTSYGRDEIVIPYDYSLDIEQAHAKAAMQLAKKLDWTGDYAAGGNDTGYVFTIIGKFNTYTAQKEEITA